MLAEAVVFNGFNIGNEQKSGKMFSHDACVEYANIERTTRQTLQNYDRVECGECEEAQENKRQIIKIGIFF